MTPNPKGDKTCAYGNLTCGYAYLGSSGCGCSLLGYCDYQLPRDSRNSGNAKIILKRDIEPIKPEEANMI